MVQVLNENLHTAANYIVSEAANIYRSRDEVTFASGAGVLKAGTVVAAVTATGKYVQFDQDGADGSQNAAGVLFAAIDASAADVAATISSRDTEVLAKMLIWPDDATDAEKNTALAAMNALGIIAR